MWVFGDWNWVVIISTWETIWHVAFYFAYDKLGRYYEILAVKQGIYWGMGLVVFWLYIQGDSSGWEIPKTLKCENLGNIWFG